MSKKPWTTGEKFLLLAIVAVVLLAGGVTFWWAHISAPVSVVIPAPVFPTPNAFDEFAAAGRAFVETKALEKWPHVPLSDARHLVAVNAVALKTLRGGLRHEYLSPPARSVNDEAPYLKDFQRLARLLALDGQMKAERGDWNGAMQSALDAVEMGQKIPRGGIILSDMVGIACGAIGRRPAWESNWPQHLSAKEARAAARRLERITAHPVSLADVLTEDKWFGQSAILEAFDEPSLWGELQPAMQMDVARWGKQGVMKNYTAYMDAHISRGRMRYSDAAKLPPVPEPKDSVSIVTAPIFGGIEWKHADNQTQNDLLLLTLALRAYKLEHDAYPETLTQLTPSYVKAIPDDPFAASGSLRYQKTSNGYALYSVGPDGKDDGGQAIKNNKGTDARSRHLVNANSKGDIVPGVNP